MTGRTTAADRMALKRQREREAGFTEVAVKIPASRKAELLAIAAKMREEASAPKAAADS
jgi:hypothetical protein